MASWGHSGAKQYRLFLVAAMRRRFTQDQARGFAALTWARGGRGEPPPYACSGLGQTGLHDDENQA